MRPQRDRPPLAERGPSTDRLAFEGRSDVRPVPFREEAGPLATPCHIPTNRPLVNPRRPRSSGYVYLWRRGQNVYAHRLAWELAHGPIPAGLCVCHRCDVPPCMNVEHLFLGTKGENNADKAAKGRAARGEQLPRAALSSVEVRAIRSRHAAGGVSYQALARDYGVCPETIGKVVRRESWRHLEEVGT